MKKYCLSFIILICLYEVCLTQNLFDANWLLGYDFSPNLDDCYLSKLDFSSGTLRIDTIHCEEDFLFDGGNIAMSDNFGNLLFYTNGCDILNVNGEIMENGEILTPGFVEDIWCGVLGHPSPNSILSLPEPCSNDIYHVFNIDLNREVILDQPIGTSTAPLRLYQSIVDISKDGGLGEVIERDKIIIQDTLSNGHLKATLHSNGLDWWVTIPEALSDCIYTFLLTQNGISDPIKRCLGHNWNNASAGSSIFSPNGKFYARQNFQNGLHIMEFDNELGLFSNPIEIQFPDDEFPINSGVSFSSNSRFLYVSARNRLYQFDMEAEIIDSSRVLVAEYDGFFNITNTIFHNSRLARDGKIYIGVFATHRNLHIIHEPNLKGIACDVEQHAIELPTINGHGMPNIPFYPPEFNSSLCTVSSSDNIREKYDLSLFPNPSSDVVGLQGTANSNFTLKIFSVDGLLLLNELIVVGQEIDVSKLPSGLLIYNILEDNVIVANGKLVKL